MREIKFRAIHRLTKKKWYAEDLVFNDGKWYENWRSFEDGFPLNMSQCVVMQYTGLKDKNGVEIYEHDILKVCELSDNDYSEYVSVVEYIESGFLVTEPYDTQVPLACFHNLETSYPLFEIEVIGNIYDNPELIE